MIKSYSLKFSRTTLYTQKGSLFAAHLRLSNILSMQMIKLYKESSSACNVPHMQYKSQQNPKSDAA